MFALGISNVLDGYEITVESVSYPYPDAACTMMTDIFLKSTAERMVIIDTDLIFEPRHVAMLLSHDVPFVAGLYPKKVRGLEFPLMPLRETDTMEEAGFVRDLKELYGTSRSPLVEVAAVARGFTNIHRSVFDHVGPTWRNMPDGSSEDFELCQRMRANGIKVLIDRRILLKHEGSCVYPIQ
jgi:hypothetical protein